MNLHPDVSFLPSNMLVKVYFLSCIGSVLFQDEFSQPWALSYLSQ
jgi:hypothetical protein